MNLQDFQKVLYLLQEHNDRSAAAYENGIDLLNFCEPIHRANSILIEAHYGKEGAETFSWWMYEKNFGRDENLKMWDKDGKEICRTIEELHSYLEKERNEL